MMSNREVYLAIAEKALVGSETSTEPLAVHNPMDDPGP